MREVLGCLLLVAAAACRPSVVFTIENADTVTLQSVIVSGDGDNVFLGNLAPGKVVTDTIRPLGEGGLFLEHGTQSRTRLTLIAYRGNLDSLRVKISKDSVLDVRR